MYRLYRLRFYISDLATPLVYRLPGAGRFGYARLLNRILWPPRVYRGLLAHLGSTRRRVFWDSEREAFFITYLVDWRSRRHACTGRNPDEFLRLLIDLFLQDGGTFVDVGANRGIHAVYAAGKLRGKGWVYAFEPHPKSFKILEAHVTMNQLDNVRMYNVGLSDEPGTLVLHEFVGQGLDVCSFLPDSFGEPSGTREVAVWRLEDHADLVPFSGSTLVKIDTEGFDLHVLKGMGTLLDYDDLTVVTEVNDGWLTKAGGSAQELFDFMHARGFVAHLVSVKSSVFWRTLALQKTEGPIDKRHYDVVFRRGSSSSPVE